MSDTTRHSEIAELIDALRPLASQAKVKRAYWITTPDGEYLSDNSNEWCRGCGTAKVKHLRKHDRKRRGDYILAGGWCTEHDTPPHCAHCNVKLEASLLTYGGLYELDHFRDNPPVPGNVDHAYEISEMLLALAYTKPENHQFALEAIEIARALIAAATPSASEKGGE